MAQRQITETLASLRRRWDGFFWKRARAGLPWYWPARPACNDAMVQARWMVRWDFGRDHHPVSRKLAQVLVTIAWPLAVFRNLWLVGHWFGSRELLLKRAPGALWAAVRHNILPNEYYEYELWQPNRRMNIDNYLFHNEAARLFKVLNRQSDVDPILDKLAFYELVQNSRDPHPRSPGCVRSDQNFNRFSVWPAAALRSFRESTHGPGGRGAERFRWDRHSLL